MWMGGMVPWGYKVHAGPKIQSLEICEERSPDIRHVYDLYEQLGCLSKYGFKVSMSGKGNCYDNAAMETFFKTIKAELIWRQTWHTRRQAELAIFEYINGFYNPRRKHSALGWKSPLAFERIAA
jgi:putative transposase